MPTLNAGRSVGLTRKEEEEGDKIWFRDLYRTEEGNSTSSKLFAAKKVSTDHHSFIFSLSADCLKKYLSICRHHSIPPPPPEIILALMPRISPPPTRKKRGWDFPPPHFFFCVVHLDATVAGGGGEN